jgi:maltose alpha-D-glucosyltransferase/alpha-amylase
LDLGRLTESQRGAVFAAFAPDANMQLYGRGIRRRLAPMLKGDRKRMELAYSLMMTLPGSPVIRYGDEIGMGDNLDLPERQPTRTPMQWSTEPQGGFSTTRKPIAPVISRGAYSYQYLNVADQRRDPNSLLNWMERIIRMRKEVPEIGWGDFEVLRSGTDDVLAIRYDWRDNSVVVVHNLSAKPCEILLSAGLTGKENLRLVNLLSTDHSIADDSGKHRILLEPYGYRWYRAGGLTYLLKRSDV